MPNKQSFKQNWLPWIIALSLWLVSTIGLVNTPPDGIVLVDAQSYFKALEQYRLQENPYGTAQQSQAIWQAIHDQETAFANGADTSNTLSGPFIYPPTLLQILELFHISPTIFMVLLLSSLIGFCWLWLRVAGASGWWLLLVLFSWDVWASFTGGNIEIALLALSLLGAWALWQKQAVIAIIPIAFVVIVKPFYALFFATLGILILANNPEKWRTNFNQLAISAFGALGLIAIAVWLWPAWVRPFAFDYLRHGLDYTWYVLPVAEQTPMSIWNRTFMQGVVNIGVSASIAQWLSLFVWGVATAVTAYILRHKTVSFSLLCALSLTLLYWFRPVGWGLVFLDVVVVTAVWQYSRQSEKKWLVGGAIVLAITHWLGLFLVPTMRWSRFLTLQSADWPWETWLVFPLALGILLTAVKRH